MPIMPLVRHRIHGMVTTILVRLLHLLLVTGPTGVAAAPPVKTHVLNAAMSDLAKNILKEKLPTPDEALVMAQNLFEAVTAFANKPSPMASSANLTDGYPLYADGETAVMVKRDVQSELPSRLLYSFPSAAVKGMPFTSDGQYAYFHKHTQTIAGWAQQVKSSTHEYTRSGVMNVGWTKNTFSAVTDKPFVGWAGKEHSTASTGWMSTDATKAAKQARRSMKILGRLAAKKSQMRKVADLTALAAFGGVVMNGFLESSLDQPHLDQVRSYARTPGANSSIASANAKDFEFLRGLTTAGMEYWDQKESLMSEDVCMHLEVTPGLTQNATHVIIPLGTPIVYASGRQSYLPYKMLQLLRGMAIFELSPTSGALEMRLTASEQFVIEGSYLHPVLGALHLAPVSPSDPVSPVDGRESYYAGYINNLQAKLVSLYDRIPKDYGRLQADPDKACPPEKLADVKKKMNDPKSFDMSSFKGRVAEMMVANIKVVQQSTGDGVDCSIVFMRDSANLAQQAQLVDETGVFAHFTMEYENGDTEETEDRKFEATTTRHWDDGIIYSGA